MFPWFGDGSVGMGKIGGHTSYTLNNTSNNRKGTERVPKGHRKGK